MKKNLSSILTAAILILSLTACGAGRPAAPSSADPAAQASPTEALPSADPVPDLPIGPATQPASAAQPTEPGQPAVPDQPAVPEQYSDVKTPDGELLGRIDARAVCTAADDGFFYSVITEWNGSTGTAEYHFFRTADRKDIFLGRLEELGYEAVYTRTELNGIVYTLVLTGNPSPSDPTPDTLWLLAADGRGGTMERCKITERGYAYAAMAAVNGKLLILNHEMDDARTEAVYEFDPASGTVRQLLALSEESGSLRSLAADGDGFCLLRVRTENGTAGLFLDRYDGGGNRLSETDITDIFLGAAQQVSGILTPEDARNELGMLVSGFSLADGRYLFYENFSVTHLILDLQTGEALFAGSDLYPLSLGGGEKVFYRMFFPGDAGQKPELYVLRDGRIMQPELTFPDDFLPQTLSQSPAGTRLVRLIDSADTGRPDMYIISQEP